MAKKATRAIRSQRNVIIITTPLRFVIDDFVVKSSECSGLKHTLGHRMSLRRFLPGVKRRENETRYEIEGGEKNPSYSTFIFTSFAFTFSDLGRVILRIPFLYEASILLLSTSVGSLTEREKAP